MHLHRLGYIAELRNLRKLFQTALRSPAVIILAAFVVRVGILVWIHSYASVPSLKQIPLGSETSRIAIAVVEGRGYSSPLAVTSGPTAWLTPVYPLLLAGVFRIFGVSTDISLVVVFMLNCIFSALTSLPIYQAGKLAFGEVTGIVAGWIWVFLPTGIFFAIQWNWDTSLGAMLFGLIFCATLAIAGSQRLSAWIGYGLLWAIGALTNPSIVSLYPFLLLWVVWQKRREAAGWLRFSALATLAFALTVSPWFVRNFLVFEKFIFFRSNFGLELWLGNNEHVLDVQDISSWWLHPNNNNEELEKYHHIGEIAFMAEKRHEAVTFILQHPCKVANFSFHRFINLWTDGASDSLQDALRHDRPLELAVYIWDRFFPLTTLIGLLFAYRAGSPRATPFAIVLAVFPLVYYITHSALRYRNPIDPVMTVLTAFAVVYFFSRPQFSHDS